MIKKLLKKNPPDMIGAVLTISLGAFIFLESSNYHLGTIRNMGPGYMPYILASLLIVFGTILLLSACISREANQASKMPSIISILAVGVGIWSFAFLVEDYGLIPGMFSAVFISTFASENWNLTRSLILAASTAVISAIVFIYLLGLQLKVFTL